MKKHTRLFIKALSVTAAAAIGCTGMIGSGLTVAFAYAQKPQAPVTTTNTPETSAEPVEVLVTVRGDAILAADDAAGQGADYLDTSEAQNRKQRLQSTQKSVQDAIRKLYPELEIGFSYDVLFNGFSCHLPESLLDEVKKLPDVENVSISHNSAAPQMTKAPSKSGYPQFYEDTGITGEGQVIAIIDSEFSVEHPAFSALDENMKTTLKKEDIEEIVASGELNADVNAAYAYRNSKVPFAVSYCDDPYSNIKMKNIEGAFDHGTHVAGIAAGSTYQSADGTEIHGIAKDAQLLLLAVADQNNNLNDAAILAALEDAVKLRANVVNMSFGTAGAELLKEDYPETTAIRALENAGIIVCKAAGNFGNGEMDGYTNYAANPDTNTMCELAKGAGTLIVASGTNNVSFAHSKILVSGKEINANIGITNMHGKHFSDIPGEYEFVYCGFGTPEDFADVDLEGKIVVAEFSESILPLLQESEVLAGAAGIILIDPEDKAFSENGYVPSSTIPNAFVSYNDGKMFREAQDTKLTLTDQYTTTEKERSAVDPYSSWGVKESLELRPDITGIGGLVESSVLSDETELWSGTSMASPYVAGCAAVVNAYLNEKQPELSGKERVQFINNLLMNSAVLYEKEGRYVSPRQQGAGLVNVQNTLSDKVLLTGAEGKAKINLYDKLGDSFGFDVNISNISDEDVSFTSAKLVLTTDDSVLDEASGEPIIEGQRSLTCTADLSALKTVAAGETRTEHIQVTLDSAETAKIAEAFVNGFFVEGFIVLDGAENCCNISIPLLGFHGDWCRLPVSSSDHTETAAGFYYTLDAGYSYALALRTAIEVGNKIDEDAIVPDGSNYPYLFQQQIDQDTFAELCDSYREGCYISPNDDGLGEYMMVWNSAERTTLVSNLYVKDTDGNMVIESTGLKYILKMNPEYVTGDSSWINLPEGDYIAGYSACINYPGSEENPVIVEKPFTVDLTAPELTTELNEKDGRKLLTITAKDNVLDGLYITGNGTGGVADTYDPENPKEHSIKDLYGVSDVPLLAGSNPQTYNESYNALGKTAIESAIANGSPTYEDIERLDFFDILPAEPDESGVYTVVYDVTDLESYTITAMDRAFNASSVSTEKGTPQELKQGIYTDFEGVYAFTDTELTIRDFVKGEKQVFNYTFDNGTLTLTKDGETATVQVEQLNAAQIRLTFEDGSVNELGYTAEGTVDDYFFYTEEEMEAHVLKLWDNEGRPIKRMEYDLLADDTTLIYLVGEGPDGEDDYMEAYHVNRLTGYGHDDHSSLMYDFGAEQLDLSAGGLWICQNGRYYWFTPDSNTGYYYAQKDGSKHGFTYSIDGDIITFMMEDGTTEKEHCMIANNSLFSLYKGEKYEDGFYQITVVDQENSFRFFTNEELKQMAADYYTAKYGKAPAEVTIPDTLSYMEKLQGFNVEIHFGENEPYYIINVQDGIGEDLYGYPVDLTGKLEPMADPFRNGIYKAVGSYEPRYYCFNGNGTGVRRSIADGTEQAFTYTMKPYGCDVQINNQSYKVFLIDHGDDEIYLDWNSGDELTETVRFEHEGDFSSVHIYDMERLKEMAAADLQKTSGAAAVNTEAEVTPDGSVCVRITDENRETLDAYMIDPITGKGTNSTGSKVDLPQTGNNSFGTIAAAAGAFLLTAAGAMLLVSVKKKDEES